MSDKPVASLNELLMYNSERFVQMAYLAILGRQPDEAGLKHYLTKLKDGYDKLQVLDDLRRSPECQPKSACIPGLDSAIRQKRWQEIPLIRLLWAWKKLFQRLNIMEERLASIQHMIYDDLSQLRKEVSNLESALAQQRQLVEETVIYKATGTIGLDNWSLFANILASPPREFIERIMMKALGRTPEPHEYSHYQHLLENGVPRAFIVDRLFSCDERSSRVTQEENPPKVVDHVATQPEIGNMEYGKVASIAFDEYASPLVSVVIPVYGKVGYTLNCLQSIQNNPPKVSFEIIIVNDASPDDTRTYLEIIKGIRLVNNEENLGFICSCNRGAELARGEFICFLNNDTQVTPGWLDELIRTFHEFPGTGLAGSKLIYPDGRLQEAGGIIWQDGSAWNFGRFQDPQLPIYNYAREVDYCSGASIVVPKQLFDQLGGFDRRYIPAYCEDADLALKLRDRGYRVIYQPLSVVVHYEGITSGTDITKGTKTYQIENSKKLFDRWKVRLKSHQSNGIDVESAKDRMAKRRALVLDHCTPTPNQDSGSLQTFNILLLLREMDFQVTFVPEDNFLYMPEYTTALQRIGIEVLYAPFCTSVEQHLKESGSRYDLAFMFRPGVVERHLKTVRKHCSNAKVLYHTVDLHYLRMMREAELFGGVAKQAAANEMKLREFAAIREVDASIVHSTTELEILRPEFPNEKIHVFSLTMNVRGTEKQFRDRRDIVFVGGYQHPPNVDAVQYFVTQVMPLLRQRLPGVRFFAVGSKPPQKIMDLAAEDVIISGFVEDLDSLLDQMRVSVAPLRYGAGIKGKIGTALAVGLPTVATPLAAEGMSLTHGKNILIADGAVAFGDAVEQLYTDETLWEKLHNNGLEFAEKSWGAEAAWTTLDSVLRDVGIPSAKMKRLIPLYSSKRKYVPCNAMPQNSQLHQDANYSRKIDQELRIYEKQDKVHDLPEIFHYWSTKHLRPLLLDAGFESIEDFFATALLRVFQPMTTTQHRFLSIGSGNCDLEVTLVRTLMQQGCSNFIFECIELNPVMLERGRCIAEEHGVLEFMRFTQDDFNSWRADSDYHGVIANQSLHHVTNLEHLFDQIKTSLHNNGVFIVSDMIGRDGHQRWPESLEIVHRFWKELPDKYKFNVLLNRHEPIYENWDCSKEGFEGIRAQDILPLLINLFNCEKFIPFGSVIDIFVDRCFGHHFDKNRKWDREFIDRVHAEDELGLKNGRLTPTHMLATFVKYPVEKPYYSRSLSPESCVRSPRLSQ